MKKRRSAKLIPVLAALGACLLGTAGLPSVAQDQGKGNHGNKGVGFILSADATEKDLGLPIYPGAHRHMDNTDESAALHMGAWGPSSGFKLVILKLDSKDSPDKVAAFYRKPLSSYGSIVDCSKSQSAAKSGAGPNGITCEDEKPVKGGYTLEAGTKEKLHVVAIEPQGKGSLISLVYVESPPEEAGKN